MKLKQFLAHHQLQENPFSEEDAQSDHVFQRFCMTGTHHPAWNKIYGNPEHPSTSIVFGEKGSGKTALRLQIVGELDKFNAEHPDQKTFVLEYDDFNPFLDAFRDRLFGRKRRPEKVISYWRLRDHMDAILSLGVNKLINGITGTGVQDARHSLDLNHKSMNDLSRLEKRDLLLLAAFYNHSHDEPYKMRWHSLRRKIKFPVWKASLDWWIALLVTILVAFGAIKFRPEEPSRWWWIISGMVVFSGWAPWLWRQIKLFIRSRRITKQIRIFDHSSHLVRNVLSCFQRADIQGQPMPYKDRSDDRYELFRKFQAILKKLGYHNIVVLVDRMDEPHLINGSAERIRDLLWPMFDNKFLKHPGLGFKMLLPLEVVYYINKEKNEFYERSRLDKQNLILSLEWTGESLFDVANDRIRACASADGNSSPNLSICDWFEDSVGREEIIRVFSQLRVPRHLFKFLHRLLVEHCQRYTEESPNWKINHEELQTAFGLYQREQQTLESNPALR